jgi:excisionase family DNA binding protein
MRLVDTEAAALALGVSARRIRQLVQEGRLTNHGTTRRVLISLDELLNFR